MQDFLSLIKKHRRVVSYGAMMFVCILILALAHWVYFENVSTSEVGADLTGDASIISRLVTDEINTYTTLAGQAAAELASASPYPSGKMYELLAQYQGSESFERTYFLSTTGRYYINVGQEIPVSPELLEVTAVDEEAHALTGLDSSGYDKITIIAPVIRRRSEMGHFIGEMKFAGSFIKDARKFLHVDEMIFVVDSEGRVILSDFGVGNDQSFEGVKNIVSYLDGMNCSIEDLNAFSKAIKTESTGMLEVSTDNGHYSFAFVPVEGNVDWTIIGGLNRGSFVSELIHQRKAEMILIIFDILMLFVVMLLFATVTSRNVRRIEAVAFSDSITAAHTKEYFRIEGARLLAEEKKIPYIVATMDIIGFRYINELFGHERGDQILRKFADLILKGMGTKEILSRNTADIFEVLIADSSSFEAKMIVVSDELNSYARSIDVSYPLFIRAGYSRTYKKGVPRDINQHLDKANAARKTINEDATKLVVEYSSSIQEEMKLRESIESAKEAAIAHDEFKLFLQPKRDLFTGKLSGAEALVRWIRVDGSMIFPDKFIPVFEENGFIERIDFYMLEKVCELQKKLMLEGYRCVPISVNQSRVLLMNPSYVEKVEAVIEKYGIPKDLIELEITETAFFEDKKRIIEVVTKLHDDGYKIDIDDFGSGYSSLNMLKDIPFDILKIDREFFGNSITGKGKIILGQVVDMATKIEADCICEGVETEEQEELLRDVGCHYGQGYLYSKPINADEFVGKFMERE